MLNEVVGASRLIDWEKAIKSFRDHIGGDATVDPSRCMRLPGTLNVKRRRPELCRVLDDESSWMRYSLDELLAAFPFLDKPIDRKSDKPENPHQSMNPAEVERLRGRWSPDALVRRGVSQHVVEGIVSGLWIVKTGASVGRSDDQSARDYAVACALLDRKFSEDEVAEVFRAYPTGVGSKVNDPRHGERYLNLTITKAKVRRCDAKAASASDRLERSGGFGTHADGGDHNEAVPDFASLEISFPADTPGNYQIHADGSIWLHPPDDALNRKTRSPELVAAAWLRIAEIHESIDTGILSAMIEFKYNRGTRSVKILRSQMVETRGAVVALGGEGAPINSNNARRVVSYLCCYEQAFMQTIPRRRTTSRFGRGRDGDKFFLPGMDGDVEFAPIGAGDSELYRAFASRAGTLGQWRDAMTVLSPDTMVIPQATVLAAFVPPLQRKLVIPNFIVDINGMTGSGKSITARLAASVWGRPRDPNGLIMQWEATKVSIEQISSICTELPIFLEDAQHASDELKKSAIYMIANGKGRSRGSKSGGIRETASWYTVVISTSEHPLHEASSHEGLRSRILPLGGLDVRPFPAGNKSFVDALDHSVMLNHGHAGEAFIRHIGNWTESQWTAWRQRYVTVRQELARVASSDIAGRISEYAAAIQIAGEIVKPLLDLKTFNPAHISRWLLQHVEDQQRAQDHVRLALQALADFYVSNQRLFHGSDPYRSLDNKQSIFGAARPNQFVGFLSATIADVLAKRQWNTTAILNKFADEGNILDRPEAGRHSRKVSVDRVKARMICIRWTALFPNGTEPPDDASDPDVNLANGGVTYDDTAYVFSKGRT